MALAEEVIVFGHSFGKVDEEYFRPYFEYILRQDIVDGQCHPKIIIFTYDEESFWQNKFWYQGFSMWLR